MGGLTADGTWMFLGGVGALLDGEVLAGGVEELDKDESMPYAVLRRSMETVSGRLLMSRVKCFSPVSRILNGPL